MVATAPAGKKKKKKKKRLNFLKRSQLIKITGGKKWKKRPSAKK